MTRRRARQQVIPPVPFVPPSFLGEVAKHVDFSKVVTEDDCWPSRCTRRSKAHRSVSGVFYEKDPKTRRFVARSTVRRVWNLARGSETTKNLYQTCSMTWCCNPKHVVDVHPKRLALEAKWAAAEAEFVLVTKKLRHTVDLPFSEVRALVDRAEALKREMRARS